MHREIAFLAQAAIEPTPLVASTINDELLSALKLEHPPSIVFKDFSDHWSGYCEPKWATEQGEVVIQAKYQTTYWTVTEEVAQRRLADIYLHEISHRFTEKFGFHNAIFATVNLALRIRANDLYPRLWSGLKIYDFADHTVDSDEVGMANAFAFAWEQGQALAASSLDVEGIAAEAARLWEQYRRNVLERPAKEAAAQDARAAMIAKFEHRIDSLQTSRYYWCGAGMWATIAVVAFIKYVAAY